MTWLAYVGALAAPRLEAGFGGAPFWWGLLCLFSLEVAAVLANERFDFETDRRNRNHGRSPAARAAGRRRLLRRGRRAIVQRWRRRRTSPARSSPPAGGAVVVLAPLAVIALGYTPPPFSSATAGWASSTSGYPSLCAILCGFVFQGGAWMRRCPGCSACRCSCGAARITLPGVPDDDDAGFRQGTLAVRTACAAPTDRCVDAAGGRHGDALNPVGVVRHCSPASSTACCPRRSAARRARRARPRRGRLPPDRWPDGACPVLYPLVRRHPALGTCCGCTRRGGEPRAPTL